MKIHLLCTGIMAGITLAAGIVAGAEQHGGHQHALAAEAAAPADVALHSACAHCGMSRAKFAHSRMLVTYADGKTVGVCSIHCAAIELKSRKGEGVASLQVGDYGTKALIDATKAFWVIGGDQRGVMTKTPKWAFAEKQAAEAFIGKHGGKRAAYGEALDLAEKDGTK
ncbi:NosL family protein [Geobacter sp. FeAm09]|uniref:nitrous oxide reductase accessory protein NosL n=1 Tax=Geobacter sp. FeAm09 TaxID=2597769 RepID=UPI0011ED5565|nr:nitrous oxide reductase accessory protein NosL [Geobacter sp. FeAm09]QEM68279.1 NosL family protein [Geobacter sp. FeAm09]